MKAIPGQEIPAPARKLAAEAIGIDSHSIRFSVCW
jgi:hypothetical protein